MSELLPGLHALDLQFQGASGSISAYLLTAPGGEAALIDTGPTTTRAALLEGLERAGIDPLAVTTVLLTHIHLDHSGGAGVLLRDNLPRARVLVHPLGLPHLVEPERLIRSATRLYGERMATLWGEIAPVAAERVAPLDDGARLTLAGHEIEVLFTPGHAAHHAAFWHRDSGVIATGDVAGVLVPGGGRVVPPTVPPEFDPLAWEESIARLLACGPTQLLLAHFGPYGDPPAHLELLRGRLHEWIDRVQRAVANGQSPEEIATQLVAHDASVTDSAAMRRLDLVAAYPNSVAGILRYLSKSG